MKYDIIVIGGGASGMMASIFASQNEQSVLLIEKNGKLGKKLSVTGNGKCNLTNRFLSVEQYGSTSTELKQLLLQYNTECILDFFQMIGICCKEKNSYYYPMSEQASSVVQLMEAELIHKGVAIHTGERLIELHQLPNGPYTFQVITDHDTYQAKKIILSTGGLAAPCYGAEGIGYEQLRKFGHSVHSLCPALVQLCVKESYVKKISGVRTDAEIILSTGKEQYKDVGEIIFTDHGVSGIPVFQISRYISKADPILQKKFTLEIDPLRTITEEKLYQSLYHIKRHNPDLATEYLFRGICNYKLVYAILTELHIKAESPCRNIDDKELNALVYHFKHIRLSVTGTMGFEYAQVTCGGIPLNEINMKTMESNLVSGLFITGELLDVDGKCGGYNLHFAWASGMAAGYAAGK